MMLSENWTWCGECSHVRKRDALCPSDATACSGSLVWELRGEEWHADPEPGLTYTIMPWSGQWVSIVFRGTRYKRGGQIGPLDDTLESAKDRCAEHYRQNAGVLAHADEKTL